MRLDNWKDKKFSDAEVTVWSEAVYETMGTLVWGPPLLELVFQELFGLQKCSKILMESIGHITNPTCFIEEIMFLVHLLRIMYHNH